MKAAALLFLTLTATLLMQGGLLSPDTSEAAAVRVKSTTGSTGANAATSFSLTALSSAPANGNTMIAVISTRGTAAGRVASITQTGVAWNKVAEATNTNGSTTEIWSGMVGAGAGTAITINLNQSLLAAAVAMEYSGLLTGSAVDKTASATGNSTTASTGTTAATIQGDELWIGGIGLVSSGYTLGTPTNSFTSVANAASSNGTATNNARVYALERIVTSTGTATTGGTVSTSSQWSGVIATFRASLLSCTTCHGGTTGFNDGTARNNPPGTFPGSHKGHVVDSGIPCASCHVAPGTTQYNHANGTINMANPVNDAGGAYGKGTSWPVTNSPTAFQSCTNTNCHGASSPAWGANTTDASCVKCHGVSGTSPSAYAADTRLAAPGYNGGRDTGGATAATDPQVGAHAVHLAGSSNYSNPIACTECHANVNPNAASFTGHMNGAGSVNFGSVASTNGATPTYGAGTCSNTYCHFGKPFAGSTPTTTASWTNTTLLTGTPSLAGDCSKCHASPPQSSSHSGITTIDQCNGCHDHVTTTGSFSDKSKHINGVLDGGCSSCHGWPPTTNAHTKHINNIIAEKGLGSLPGGFVNNQVCGVCHNVSSTTKHMGSAGNDGTSRNIFLPSPSTLQASYQFGPNPVSYDKGNTTVCSNISCHFGTSPAWGTPPTTTCQACHGSPPLTTSADPDNKHVSPTPVNHIGTGATVNTKTTFVSQHGGCQICHGTQSTTGTGTGTTHDPHANYTVSSQHATGSLNMNGPTGTGTGYNTTNRGCDAACHANDTTHRMTASGMTIAFGNYGSGGDCVSCHSIAQSSPIAQALNSTVTSRAAAAAAFGRASNHVPSPRTGIR
jgi:predicted CxxxxCH...CXXCH cytochrome family protein